jgi:hypothetical protein
MANKRAGLPQEGGDAATTEPKKGRGPNKPKGLSIELPGELESEIQAVAQRIGNGNAAHSKAAREDISALISKAHQDFAKSHIGKVGDLYYAELKRRAAEPLRDAVQ